MKGLLEVLKLVSEKMPANQEISKEIKAIEDKLQPGCLENVTEEELNNYKERVRAILDERPGVTPISDGW